MGAIERARHSLWAPARTPICDGFIDLIVVLAGVTDSEYKINKC
jgi:hypothetical protein